MKLCTYMEYYPKFNFHSHSAHFLHDFLLTSALLAPTSAIFTDFVNMNMKLGKWTPGIPKCPYIYQKYIFCQCRKNQQIWIIFSRKFQASAPVKNDDVIAKNSHISAKNSPNLIIFPALISNLIFLSNGISHLHVQRFLKILDFRHLSEPATCHLLLPEMPSHYHT